MIKKYVGKMVVVRGYTNGIHYGRLAGVDDRGNLLLEDAFFLPEYTVRSGGYGSAYDIAQLGLASAKKSYTEMCIITEHASIIMVAAAAEKINKEVLEK